MTDDERLAQIAARLELGASFIGTAADDIRWLLDRVRALEAEQWRYDDLARHAVAKAYLACQETLSARQGPAVQLDPPPQKD